MKRLAAFTGRRPAAPALYQAYASADDTPSPSHATTMGSGRQIHERVDLVAASKAERGAPDEKEGDVGAKRCGDGHQARLRQPEPPDAIQADEARRGVAAPAAESRL